jgi:hypothetical protein
MAILKEFWRLTDDERRLFAPRLIENERNGSRVVVFVEMHPEFEYSTGGTIERPWLRLLTSTSQGDDHIGLGWMKCRAVYEVENQLKEWLAKQGFPE